MAVPRSKTDTIVPKDVLFIPAGYGVYCHILEAIGYKQKLAVVLASVYRPPPPSDLASTRDTLLMVLKWVRLYQVLLFRVANSSYLSIINNSRPKRISC